MIVCPVVEYGLYGDGFWAAQYAARLRSISAEEGNGLFTSCDFLSRYSSTGIVSTGCDTVYCLVGGG